MLKGRVFPTHVGVFLIDDGDVVVQWCLPHARGGVSKRGDHEKPHHRSSPRTWGCFSIGCGIRCLWCVFPTHVGVFLIPRHVLGSLSRLPHARGGVSGPACRSVRIHQSSPRTWGCFRDRRLIPLSGVVFPTHVGVFLKDRWHELSKKCLPHARGGVSRRAYVRSGHGLSSPRTWGCFC